MDIILVYVIMDIIAYIFFMYVLHEMNGGLASLNFIVYDSFV